MGDTSLDDYDQVSGSWTDTGFFGTSDDNAILITKEESPTTNYMVHAPLIPNEGYWGPPDNFESESEFMVFACWADSNNHLYVKVTYHWEWRHAGSWCQFPNVGWAFMWSSMELHSVIGGSDTTLDSWSSYYPPETGPSDPEPDSSGGSGYARGVSICVEDGTASVGALGVWRDSFIPGHASLGKKSGLGTGVLGTAWTVPAQFVGDLNGYRIDTYCRCKCRFGQKGTRPDSIQLDITGVTYGSCGADCDSFNMAIILDAFKAADFYWRSNVTSDDYCSWAAYTGDICGNDWLIIATLYVDSGHNRATVQVAIYYADSWNHSNCTASVLPPYMYGNSDYFRATCDTVDIATSLDGLVLTSFTDSLPCVFSNASIAISVP